MPYASWPGRWQMNGYSPGTRNVTVVVPDAPAGTVTSVGRDAEAVSPQRTGLSLEPKRAGASRRLGEMLVRLGRHDEAIAPLETAIAVG